MNWLQIKIKTSGQLAEKLSDYLQLQDAVSVTYQDAGNEPLYEPPLNDLVVWQEIFVIALFNENTEPEIILAGISALIGADKFEASIETIADQAWERAWMTDFQPMQFGKRLWILPSYLPLDALPDHCVILDPGLAFGTGTHPTTALCLEWLDENLKSGMTVIDYGCGSGILGIAALRLGAKQVWAIDHDPQAIHATYENAARNHIHGDKLQCFLPNELPPVKADVLIANILANPLIELASSLATLIKDNGVIVLSGILENQIDLVREAYQHYFIIQNIDQKQEWIRVVGRKKS